MIELLEQQADLLLQIALPVGFAAPKGRARHFAVVPAGGTETVRSICDLARKGRLADCMMLSRSVVEWIVNYCFLLVCNEEHATAFEQHSTQRQFRNLNRSIAVGQMGIALRCGGTPDPDQVPGLREALDAFTSKSGKEITRWTPLHLHDRIRIFAERSKVNAYPILGLTFWAYDDASEILHGTLYGSLAGHSIHGPGVDNVETAIERRNSSLSFMAFAMTAALDMVIQAIAEQVDLEPIGLEPLRMFSEERSAGIAKAMGENLGK